MSPSLTGLLRHLIGTRNNCLGFVRVPCHGRPIRSYLSACGLRCFLVIPEYRHCSKADREWAAGFCDRSPRFCQAKYSLVFHRDGQYPDQSHDRKLWILYLHRRSAPKSSWVDVSSDPCLACPPPCRLVAPCSLATLWAQISRPSQQRHHLDNGYRQCAIEFWDYDRRIGVVRDLSAAYMPYFS